MFSYGKTATNAIAVMSYIAAKAPQRVGSADAGNHRDLSPVFTAKLLTQLASAGFLSGQPGPGGGYTLAKDPAEIRLIEIVALFEQIDVSSRCPFGVNWCGNGAPCPLHDTIIDLSDRNRRFLEETRLSVFQEPARATKPRHSPVKKTTHKAATNKAATNKAATKTPAQRHPNKPAN